MIESVGQYHALTKHRPDRFAPGPGALEWALQPDPFRRFAGAETIDLPLVDGRGLADYDSLYAPAPGAPQPPDLRSLGLFLELALGLSAWKSLGGTRWALRNCPSSGNLHPSEAYLVFATAPADALQPGVYHYAPEAHALEARGTFGSEAQRLLADVVAPGGFLVGLASIHWREAWKYGERAFRYCQHDSGHAIAALRFAARVFGWTLRLLPEPSDGEIAALLGLDRDDDFPDGEREAPCFLALVDPAGGDLSARTTVPDLADAARDTRWHGTANRLSRADILWPAVEEVAALTLRPDRAPLPDLAFAPAGPGAAEPATSPAQDAVSIIRKRRSAVAMDGETGIAKASFLRMLARTLPDPARPPWDAFPYAPALHLALFVHRVDGLAPGLYMFVRDSARLPALRAACDPAFAWTPVAGAGLPLYALVENRDLMREAAFIACRQALAGQSAFSLGMIADFDGTLAREGAWAYRRLHWEAGMVGQVLYLEAEALGLGATGIGCFFDDAMHAVLGFAEGATEWQDLYHFSVGGAVEDARLQSFPPYAHLERATAP